MTAARRLLIEAAAALAALGGGAAMARARRRRKRDYRVFIVEYHEISTGDAETEGVVSAARFRRHLRRLARSYRPAPLSDAVERLRRPGGLDEDLVCVTLDDGYASTHDPAQRILREESIPATVFLTSGFLDGAPLWFDVARRCLDAARCSRRDIDSELERDLKRVLGHWPLWTSTESAVERLKSLPTDRRRDLLERLEAALPALPPGAQPLCWDRVREMIGRGMEVGCHTVTHPILSSLPPRVQEEEIRRSRDRITAETGTPPTLFAYPNGDGGDFDAITVDLVRDAGFAAACTTVRGSNRPGCDPYRLRRIGVGADSCALLEARLEVFPWTWRRQRAPRRERWESAAQSPGAVLERESAP